jgi:hypothetical protein
MRAASTCLGTLRQVYAVEIPSGFILTTGQWGTNGVGIELCICPWD